MPFMEAACPGKLVHVHCCSRSPSWLTTSDAPFEVDTWSSDGALLAGAMLNDAGNPVALGVWDVRGQRLHKRIDMPLVRSTTIDVSFVPGTHGLLANTPAGLALVDADTGRARVILKVAPPFENRLSGDGRTLLVERPSVEADLWLMELAK